MEERLRFVARRLEGESMTVLCREFGISRKTGHKLFARLGRTTGWRRSPTVRGGITPGKPQQNGRHERMHLTLKQETTRPAAANSLSQQAASTPSSTRSTANARTRPWR